jgi:hypothetical protein
MSPADSFKTTSVWSVYKVWWLSWEFITLNMQQNKIHFTFLIREDLCQYFEQPATASDLTFVKNFTLYSWVFFINIIPPSLLLLLCTVFYQGDLCWAWSLGEFLARTQSCEKRLLRHISPTSFRPHETTRLPLDGFLMKCYYLIAFRTFVEKIRVSLKSDKNSMCFARMPDN